MLCVRHRGPAATAVIPLPAALGKRAAGGRLLCCAVPCCVMLCRVMSCHAGVHQQQYPCSKKHCWRALFSAGALKRQIQNNMFIFNTHVNLFFCLSSSVATFPFAMRVNCSVYSKRNTVLFCCFSEGQVLVRIVPVHWAYLYRALYFPEFHWGH